MRKYTFLIILLLVLVSSTVLGHDTVNGINYPEYCCAGKDCMQVPCEQITPNEDGSYIWNGIRFLKEYLQNPIDGQCHVCTPNGSPRCIFLPKPFVS